MPDSPTFEAAESVLTSELLSGTLNVYFDLFLEKFPYEQRAILYAISRGAKTYSSIAKQFTSINVVRALRDLVKANIVRKIEKTRKKSYLHHIR